MILGLALPCGFLLCRCVLGRVLQGLVWIWGSIRRNNRCIQEMVTFLPRLFLNLLVDFWVCLYIQKYRTEMTKIFQVKSVTYCEAFRLYLFGFRTH